MNYIIFFILSMAAVIAGVIISIIRFKHIHKSVLLILFISVAIGIFFLFLPLYFNYFDKQLIKTILISLHNTIRVFVIDADFEFVMENIKCNYAVFAKFYSAWFSLLYIVAPVLTASFLLELLLSFKSSFRLKFCHKKNYYVFSMLNKKSITLAEDIYKKEPKNSLIIFMDTKRDSEEYNEYSALLKEIKSITFKDKVYDLELKKLKRKQIYVFLVNDFNNTLGEEITTSLIKLIDKYKNYENLKVYAFTNSKSSELVISSIGQKEIKDQTGGKYTLNDVNNLIVDLCYENTQHKDAKWLDDANPNEVKKKFIDAAEVLNKLDLPKIEIHRVDYAKNMIYSYLPKLNDCLFKDGSSDIQVAVIGLGNYGKLMTKTLCWYCQIPNKKITINCFDNDRHDQNYKLLYNQAPELFNKNYDNKIEDEARFKINYQHIQSALNFELEEKLSEIKNPNLIFISLGDDELNIQVACNIRSLYARLRQKVKIVTVVYNNEIIDSIKYASVKDEAYDIDYIGSIKSIYCQETIFNSELDQIGLEAHQDFTKQPYNNVIVKDDEINNIENVKKVAEQLVRNSFFLNEYNYNSSIASAIHYNLYKYLNLFNVNGKQSPEEHDLQSINEHRRWDAYVMSVGYRPTEHHDKKERTDMGKLHHDLRRFTELSKEEQDKDSMINESHKNANK